MTKINNYYLSVIFMRFRGNLKSVDLDQPASEEHC